MRFDKGGTLNEDISFTIIYDCHGHADGLHPSNKAYQIDKTRPKSRDDQPN